MAQTAKPAEQQRSQAGKVAVTNGYRNQPVLFHVLGGSVRLEPLETRELDRQCLASPELSQLVLTGALRVQELAAETADTADEDDTAARRQKPERRRSAGPRDTGGR